MIHYASETQPNQPLIRVTEERDEYGDPVDGPKISKKEKEKNLKKNEKDEDHTTTTNESAGVKRDQNMRYIKNSEKGSSKKDPNMTSDMLKTYRKNMVLSHEPEGEVIKEEEKEKENPTFVQFMQRIEQLPEVTREAIKNCGNDPAIAKAALEISGIDK